MLFREERMKKAIALTLFVAACAAAAEMDDAKPQVPRKAMEFGIQTGPGKYTWLSEYAGKTCVVAFIFTTCPHCQFTTGILNKLQADYAARGVQIIESAVEPMAALHIPDFEKTFHPAFPVGYNDQRYVARFLGFSEDSPLMFPSIAFIDRHGIIRVEFAGDDKPMSKDVQEKNLREALEKTIKEGQAPLRTPGPR
jgi:peroxiredoxin